MIMFKIDIRWNNSNDSI